jgi:outer membrane protein assembly factor BamB
MRHCHNKGRKHVTTVLCWSAAALAVVPGLAGGGDWLGFRGTDSRGYSTQTNLPTGDDLDQCIAWKEEIPGRAVSGPIVVDGRVITTSSGGPHDDQLYVVALDAQTGQELWQRGFWATGRTMHHPTSALAAPTPASDGRLIFAFYSSNDLICLDLDGNLKWLRGLTADYPDCYNDTGMASSPAVIGDTVIVQLECQGDSFAAGLDKRTGETLWRAKRQAGANWASPITLRSTRGDSVLLQSPDRLTAHDARTGQMLWSYDAACSSIPTATTDGRQVYLPSGGLTALRLDDQGHARSPQVGWKENRLAPGSASPIVADGRVYIINGGGVLVTGDARTGKVLGQLRLSGTFWATPVVAGDRLYAVNQDGLLQVVRLSSEDAKGEVVARHELGEGVFGSPAIGDGALYIRGEKHLWRIAGK